LNQILEIKSIVQGNFLKKKIRDEILQSNLDMFQSNSNKVNELKKLAKKIESNNSE